MPIKHIVITLKYRFESSIVHMVRKTKFAASINITLWMKYAKTASHYTSGSSRNNGFRTLELSHPRPLWLTHQIIPSSSCQSFTCIHNRCSLLFYGNHIGLRMPFWWQPYLTWTSLEEKTLQGCSLHFQRFRDVFLWQGTLLAEDGLCV